MARRRRDAGRGARSTGFFAGIAAGFRARGDESLDRWVTSASEDVPMPTRRRVLGVPLLLFAGIAVGYVARLVYLQVIKAEEYSAAAVAERTTTIEVEARRGTIYDRNGIVLAISVDAKSVYVDPTLIEDADDTAEQIAAITGDDPDDFIDALTDDSGSYILSKIDVDEGEAIEELGITGIYVVDDSRREYPCGQVGGQIVGACNTEVKDGKEYYSGISGLELQYDDVLQGTDGYYVIELAGDYSTTIVGSMSEYVEAVDGQDLVLSIDVALQEYVEERLTEGIEDLAAEDGSALVIDSETGEIYAAVSLPLFNPADRSVVEEGATTLKCITKVIEPGSAFKSVSMLAILEDGEMDADTTIYCPSSISASGYTVTDSHDRDPVTYTLRQILAYSSNVGISLAVESMGFEKFYDAIERYKLTEYTDVDYYGEAKGSLVEYGSTSWSTVTGYNVSFGQGVSVTPLEVARFYCMVANDGLQTTPHFVVAKTQSEEELVYESEQIVDDQDAIDTLVSMLGSVVEYGTGTAAAIDGYTVVGKTSTAEIYDSENGGYKSGVYYLAFIGFMPESSSSLVCFVGANEVAGGGVVTPIFKDIMEYCIDLYDITS